MNDRVDLSNRPVDDKDINELAGLLRGHRLLELDLSGTHITDQGLKHLQPVASSIGELWLARTDITNEGIRSISMFDNIVFLDLSGTRTDWRGLELLTLPRLLQLSLGNEVTEKELDALSPERLPNLRYLELPPPERVKMNPKDLQKLMVKYPSLTISFRNPANN
jgi:hypothetical protein